MNTDRARRAQVGPRSPSSAPLLIAVCGLPFEAAIAAGPGVVTVCGPGPERVAARLEFMLDAPLDTPVDALLHVRPDAPRHALPGAPLCAPGAEKARPPAGPRWAGIISFGCAGALDPALASGACVVAGGVLTVEGVIAADPAWTRALLARLPGARACLLAGVDAPLASAADKRRRWRDSGACAVDMESHAAALAARRHGLPFAACRVVLDPAWRSLPPIALAALREDGSTALAPLLRGLGADPRQLAPLCALAREAWIARRALRRVRAQLGPALGLAGADA